MIFILEIASGIMAYAQRDKVKHYLYKAPIVSKVDNTDQLPLP